jgi:type VI secretion system secreted protein VgrG
MNALVDFLALSQHARLVTLTCATQQAVADALVAEQFTGREGVNELFAFELDALSTSADLDIDVLVGVALRIGLLQPDGSRRAWHGICTHAGALGADGGLARYRLRIEPALAQLEWRRDSHLFQDVDARAIVADLLADYPDVQCDFDVSRPLAPRAICTQYRETDYAFFCRLLASEGLNWRFDHDEQGHRLVIFDAAANVPATPGGAVLRFHGVRATEVDDAIDSWHARRSAGANAVALSSWDPAELVAPAAQQASRLDAGDLPPMQVYDGSGERIASGPATPGGAAADHGQLMLQALERDHKTFMGAGAVRRLAAGHGFTLTQHAHFPHGENAFTVLWVTHAARNNLRTGIKESSARAGDTYRNQFACVRDSVALVPPATAAAHPCTAFGTQVALVVGLPGTVATTTRDHQVKIQFAWQRGARPNPGGLEHGSVSGGNAPGDASCGAWVRVAESLAGPNWGSQFIPRLGTEVLVAFIEGDIDRPVIIGQLHNGVAPPPFPAGVDAPANHPGVLSGIHSENFDGGGYNQWQLDDTQNQTRMRLASSSAAAELSLGVLVAQAAGSSTRGASRGSGFELRTAAWVTLRGAQGVLLSTSARVATGTGVTSTQMDVQEAVSLFKGAHTLDGALTQAAGQHHALASKAACKAQTDWIALVDPAANGKYEGPVNGQLAARASAGSREVDAAQPVERFGAPVVLFDAAASMNWATAASTVINAGQQLHWTTQSDLHMAAGATCSTVAGNNLSLFTHGGGIQAIAADGPVSVEAHTDQLEIVADQEVAAVSVNDVITIQGKTRVVLQAGQSSITLEGGDITFACPGNFTAKGGMHALDKGEKSAAALTKLPDSRLQLFDLAFILRDKETGEPVQRQPYRLKREDGTYEAGFTGERGETHVITSAEAEPVGIELLTSSYAAKAPLPSSGAPHVAPKYREVSHHVTAPVDVKQRQEVRVSLPTCWIEDYESEVGISKVRPYSITTNTNGEEKVFLTQIKYKIYIPVRSNTPVVVEVRFKIRARFLTAQKEIEEESLPELEKLSRRAARDAAIEKVKYNFDRGVRLGWNEKFILEISDPVCGNISLPITYKVHWTESDEHFTLDINEDIEDPRESVNFSFLNAYINTKAWVFAHEFGHCIGLPDEYSVTRSEERVIRYYKPDGSLDRPLKGLRDGQEKTDGDTSIMSTRDSREIFPRHAWNIAIEAQDILSKKIGRAIKCDISLVS